MSYVTIVWSSAAAAALLLAIVHAALWAMDRKATANLALAVVAGSLSGVAITELGMMVAASAADWAFWVRWCHLPLFLHITAIVIFVRLFLGTGRAWLMWTIIALRLVVLIANFSAGANFNFANVATIDHVDLLGEPVAVFSGGEVSHWQWIATLSCILLVAYVLDAIVQRWRSVDRETRRSALVIGGSIVFFLTLSIVATQVVIWGLVAMPMLITPLFFGALGAMAYELSRDMLRAGRLASTLREAEHEAADLRRALTHAGRVTMLGQLSSALAHELSQPLAAILRNAETAEILLASPTPDIAELRAIVADIQRDDRRAGDVIDRLRALLKRRELQMQPTSVDSLVKDAGLLVRAEASARRVSIELLTDDALPLVAGDRVHLLQVLINLIINAVDATCDERNARRHVTVTAHSAGRASVEICVADSGSGISLETLPRIFEPFFTTKAGGMGMGLAVSRTIIEAHGGKLWAENSTTGGAIFRVALPAIEEAA